ncbi:MAG: hypothetical protein IKF83_01500 [Clostridia bacterium]|nr:hypothetical protein [Clostridia bacterium]
MTLKDNKKIYINKYNKEIKDILQKVKSKEIKIEELDDDQKDKIIGYYVKDILEKKEKIKKMRESIKKGKM